MKKILVILAISVILLQACKSHSVISEVQLLSDTTHKSGCESFTSDKDGNPVISWCENDNTGNKQFFFSHFDKEKKSFSERINIPIEKNTSFHEEGMPKLAIKNDGTIVAVYEVAAPTENNRFAGNIKYIQSFNNDKSWTVPGFLHADTAAGESHSFVAISRLANGEIGASWLDVSFGTNKDGRSVKFAATNGQNGFSNEKIIDSFACQCCRTALSCDAKGNVSVMFRDLISDSVRDISVCTSADNGATFTKAYSFSKDNWVVNGCPHNGPSVVCNNGNSYVTWFTGGGNGGLYYASLNKQNNETARQKITGTGRNVQLCLLPNNEKIIVYNVNQKLGNTFYSKISVDKIVLGKTFTMDITLPKADASYPVVYALNNNEIVVAWQNKNSIYYRIIDTKKITAVKKDLSQANNAMAMKDEMHCGM